MTLTVPLSEAKQQLGALVDTAHLQHEPVSLTKRGKRVAVLLDADDFDRMRELLEDVEDAQAAIDARREVEETAATPIPWDEVKAELGLS
jgi:prevent-host-death family protein